MDNNDNDLKTRLSKLEETVLYIKNAIDSMNKQAVDQRCQAIFRDNENVGINSNEQQQTPLEEHTRKDDDARGRKPWTNEKSLIDVNSSTKTTENNEENKELRILVTDEKNDLISGLENRSQDQTLNRLIDHISRLETSVTNQTNVIRQTIKLDKVGGFYEHWETRHQSLLTAVYVSQPVFLEAFWRLQSVIQLRHLGRELVDRVLGSLPTHTVTRSSRFPEYGLYLNVNDYDLYKCIQYMREYCYMSSPEGSKGNYTEELKQALDALREMALTAADVPIWMGMADDLTSFERKNGLRWVDNN